jgi:hypothetical protein
MTEKQAREDVPGEIEASNDAQKGRGKNAAIGARHPTGKSLRSPRDAVSSPF